MKALLWNTIGSSILRYAMESIDLIEIEIKHLSILQGNIIKSVKGVSKYSHHSNILKYLDDVIKNNAMRLDILEQTSLQETCNLPF